MVAALIETKVAFWSGLLDEPDQKEVVSVGIKQNRVKILTLKGRLFKKTFSCEFLNLKV